MNYAKDRQQFGRAIVDFGMIREKLADMAIRTYMSESIIYRTVGMIDAALEGVDRTDREYPAKASEAIREYAVECAICKVYGSEAVDFLVDETVQIHGGYGYTAEFPAERFYRDARINRIFEGTNEVNRLLVPGEFLKRAMKGKLPLMAAGQKLLGEIMEYSPLMVELPDEPLALQAHMIEMIKKAVIFVAGVAAQKFMTKLGKEQELLARIADMAIQAFALESGLLRAKKAVAEKGEAKAAFHVKAGGSLSGRDPAQDRSLGQERPGLYRRGRRPAHPAHRPAQAAQVPAHQRPGHQKAGRRPGGGQGGLSPGLRWEACAADHGWPAKLRGFGKTSNLRNRAKPRFCPVTLKMARMAFFNYSNRPHSAGASDNAPHSLIPWTRRVLPFPPGLFSVLSPWLGGVEVTINTKSRLDSFRN